MSLLTTMPDKRAYLWKEVSKADASPDISAGKSWNVKWWPGVYLRLDGPIAEEVRCMQACRGQAGQAAGEG